MCVTRPRHRLARGKLQKDGSAQSRRADVHAVPWLAHGGQQLLTQLSYQYHIEMTATAQVGTGLMLEYA